MYVTIQTNNSAFNTVVFAISHYDIQIQKSEDCKEDNITLWDYSCLPFRLFHINCGFVSYNHGVGYRLHNK
jgi:hypothetical protein